MNNLDEELAEYFKNKHTTILSQNEVERLKYLTKKNKVTKKHSYRWIPLSVSTCFILLLCLFIPLFVNVKKTNIPSVKYYTDTDLSEKSITEEECFNIINKNCAKYNFIFESYETTLFTGLFVPDNNELLAVRINFVKKSVPFTTANILFVFSEQFIKSDEMSYTYNADVTSTDNYTLYLREETNLFKEYLFAFFKYSNYRMYLSLDLIDEDILNDLL